MHSKIHLSLSHFPRLCLASVKSRQILTAHVREDGDSSSVEVSYVMVVVETGKPIKLERDSVTFVGPHSDCTTVADDVLGILRTRESHRPKRVLVFMNPHSGWRKSVSQYRDVVAPIFEHCGVQAHVIQTKYKAHAEECLMEYDLSTIDVLAISYMDPELNLCGSRYGGRPLMMRVDGGDSAYRLHIGTLICNFNTGRVELGDGHCILTLVEWSVVSVGGDGSLNQVCTGMLARAAKDAGIDMDDEGAVPQRPHIPIAIIPCGSGNVVSTYVNLGRDAATVAYNIVLGRTTPADVNVLRTKGRFLSYGMLMHQVGVYEKPLEAVERLRFLGPRRYRCWLWAMWWHWKELNLEIQYLPFPDDHTLSDLEKDENEGSHDTKTTPASGWKTRRGGFYGVTCTQWEIQSFLKYCNVEYNIYRRPNVSTGKAVLQIVNTKSFREYSDLFAVGVPYHSRDPAVADHIAVSECRIRAVDGTSYKMLMEDGEAIHLTDDVDIHIKVHKHALDYICVDYDLVAEALEHHPILLSAP